MTRADVVSVVALLVSVASLCFSVYFNLRDKARIVTGSRYLNDWDGAGAHIEISIVNAGRRPIILRMWGGDDGTTRWVGEILNGKDGGIRLAEHERHAITLSKDDLSGDTTPDETIEFTNLWFEDTLGRRHVVRKAREHIERLRAE